MSELSQLQEIKFHLEAKVERLSRQHQEVKRQYDAVITTLNLLTDNKPKGQNPGGIGVEPAEVTGKTLKAALLYVAEKCDGILKVTPTRKLLVEANVLRNGQSGSNRISATLIEMPEFERVSRGKYRLFDESNNPDDNTLTTRTDSV